MDSCNVIIIIIIIDASGQTKLKCQQSFFNNRIYTWYLIVSLSSVEYDCIYCQLITGSTKNKCPSNELGYKWFYKSVRKLNAKLPQTAD